MGICYKLFNCKIQYLFKEMLVPNLSELLIYTKWFSFSKNTCPANTMYMQ